MIEFDPTDYTLSPENLPDESAIRKALRIGGIFKLNEEKQYWEIWFGGLPRVSSKTQVEAAKLFVKL